MGPTSRADLVVFVWKIRSYLSVRQPLGAEDFVDIGNRHHILFHHVVGEHVTSSENEMLFTQWPCKVGGVCTKTNQTWWDSNVKLIFRDQVWWNLYELSSHPYSEVSRMGWNLFLSVPNSRFCRQSAILQETLSEAGSSLAEKSKWRVGKDGQILYKFFQTIEPSSSIICTKTGHH